jgi:uncharacterized protein YyaL (SSP411 family)
VSPPITALAPFTEQQRALDGSTTAYVCRGHVCNRPTTDPDEMLEMMGEGSPERGKRVGGAE